jgi:molybdenum cofactor biosynthesis enzyme MoaA
MDINLNLELTDHCNIKCGMCSQSLRDEAHGVPKRFMAWDTWRKALSGLADLEDQVHLCPHWLGEPTIHPEFDKFIEYAFAVNHGNRLFRSFKLHTNAVVFGERRARLLVDLANAPGQAEDTFRWVHFSVDAFSQAAYTAVKGADKRAQVYANIHRFLSVRAERAAAWPKVTLAFVVQPGNAHEADRFLAHWSDALTALGSEVAVTYDWPSKLVDSVYFRPLNTGDQGTADQLHASTVRGLGMTVPAGDRLRATGSF